MSDTPPYRQLAAILRAKIESGEYPPGSALPSLTHLTQTYGVARMTARKAIGVLVDEGLAKVTQGWGTHVRRSDRA